MPVSLDNNLIKIEMLIQELCKNEIQPLMSQSIKDAEQRAVKEFTAISATQPGNLAMSSIDGRTTGWYQAREIQPPTSEEISKSYETRLESSESARNSMIGVIAATRQLLIESIGEETYLKKSQEMGADLASVYVQVRAAQSADETVIQYYKPKNNSEYFIGQMAAHSFLIHNPLKNSDIMERARDAYHAPTWLQATASVTGMAVDGAALAPILGPSSLGSAASAAVTSTVWDAAITGAISAYTWVADKFADNPKSPTEIIADLSKDITGSSETLSQAAELAREIQSPLPLQQYDWQNLDQKPVVGLLDAILTEPTTPQELDARIKFQMAYREVKAESQSMVSSYYGASERDLAIAAAQRAGLDSHATYLAMSQQVQDVPESIRATPEQLAEYAEEQTRREQIVQEPEPQDATLATVQSAPQSPTMPGPSIESILSPNYNMGQQQGGGGEPWAALAQSLGMDGFTTTMKNLPQIIANIPDLMMGVFSGKNMNMGADGLVPLAFMMFGGMTRNPWLKLLLIGGGAAALLNKAGHQIMPRSFEPEVKTRYVRHEEEPLNKRINNPQLVGHNLFLRVDGQEHHVVLPDDIIRQKDEGCISLNNIANQYLRTYDASVMAASIDESASQSRQQGRGMSI